MATSGKKSGDAEAAAIPYSIRYDEKDGSPVALVLARPLPGSTPPLPANNAGEERPRIEVQLIHLLQRLARISRSDKEVPVATVYAHLGRLRSLAAEAQALNDITDHQLAHDAELADRYQRLLDTLTSFGYGMPPAGRLPVYFEGVGTVVELIENAHATLIQEGRAARNDPRALVPYMALQEYYQAGDIVISRSMGDLGGTLVGLRVVDAYYESIKSVFGNRKYSFHLALETVVALGGEFVSVSFVHIFEEWESSKEQSRLPFQLLRRGHDKNHESNTTEEANTTVRELIARANILRQVVSPTGSNEQKQFSYQHYQAGCFFPHIRGGGTQSFGGASSADRKMSSGRLIVDSLRGLELGHAPIASVDEVGIAIAMTTRTLRNVQRAGDSGGDAGSAGSKQRSQKLASAGLRVWSSLPAHHELICWPTVAAFSLNVKQWGHVLVDGLSPVVPCDEAWDQLVLPPKTKEMLLAMTASTRRRAALAPVGVGGESSAPGGGERYRFRDVVDSKGGGVLFLLYGPPGTGKTLSVEALALRFGCPLYSLSFAELGSSVGQLEERLTDVLALAAHWGALVLLDEGDALVERRERGQFMLNSMTGVLLRLLETFDGALFITSNRVSTFDPAALSRVTLAIHYEALDLAARREIWFNALRRIHSDERDAETGVLLQRTPEHITALINDRFDLDTLAKYAASGRAVGAIMRLAIALCQQRQCEISQVVLMDAIEVWEAFSKDLTAEREDFT